MNNMAAINSMGIDNSQYQPDASGTVVISGHEELALAYDLKSGFYSALEGELDTLKGQLRSVASSVLLVAGEGAKRVFLRNGKKGGISITRPDYSQTGNRLVLSDTKMAGVTKSGELDSLGVPLSELFEETVTEVGGEVVELRGRWAAWFVQHMGQYMTPTETDISHEVRKRATTRRLLPAAIERLQQLMLGGSEVAKVLLSLGTKEMIVKPER